MVSKSQLAIDWPVFRPRRWGQPVNSRPLPKPWFGLDTERDSKTGEFVCGFAVGEKVHKFRKIPDLPFGTHWIWNIGYDIEGMLRDLDIAEAWAAKSDGSSFPLLGGTACYYHGKRFDLKTPAGNWNFIEASSFFGRRPLASMGAKENIDSSKMSLARYLTNEYYEREVKVCDRETKEEKWIPSGTFGYYADDVDRYCIQDARLVYDNINTLDLGVNALGVSLGATPGATARRFLARLGPYPEVLWRTHKAFLRSYCGGRFEVTKRGVLHDLIQYDIVSAYPWALAKCPWLTDSAYERITRRFSECALYGSYEVSFDYDNYLGVAPRWKNGVRVYSKKESRTWLTRPEVKWLLDRNVRVEIHGGVEVFDENATDLWASIIHPLFTTKQRGKNEADGGWGAKIILNSQYGIVIQLVRRSGEWVPLRDAKNPVDFAGSLALEEAPKEFEAGNCYAPLYAGNLTGLTRCKLLDAAEEVGPEAYVGGHTDSILTTRPLKMLGEELGDWKFEKSAARADVCKTGMYAMGDIVKIRGITRKGISTQLWEESLQRRSRIGIKSADSWDKVSVIVPKKVANNYSVENKRKWNGEVTRGLIAAERFVDSEALANVC